MIIISRSENETAAHSAFEDALAARCAAAGTPVLVVPHLYHLPEDSPLFTELASTGPHTVLCRLHPRPAEWLLRRHGIEPVTVLNLDACTDLECCLREIPGLTASIGEAAPIREWDEETARRWYPVVDKSRCSECSHCLQFCLFGVYDRDGVDRVRVVNPDRCKPGCPACSRICPQGAIIFPLYDKDAAIAGAPGLLMTPDPAAKRMFYQRTKNRCPVCGQEGAVPTAHAEQRCPECGRPVSAPEPEDRVVRDEIDALVDDLEKLIGREP